MSVKKFDSPLYSHTDVYFSSSGTDTIPEYILDYPERGGVCLKKVGEKPIYAMIQANKVNCDLHSVLETVVHENQSNVVDLSMVTDMVADFTVPQTLGELYSGMKRVEQTWEELPIEAREMFNSDVRTFVRNIGMPDFQSKLEAGYKDYYSSLNKRVKVDSNSSLDSIPSSSGNTDINVKDVIENGSDASVVKE